VDLKLGEEGSIGVKEGRNLQDILPFVWNCLFELQFPVVTPDLDIDFVSKSLIQFEVCVRLETFLSVKESTSCLHQGGLSE
jgi:hypothetical protein